MSYIVIFLHFAGLCSALHAVIYTRTPQAAVAWPVALVGFPYVSVFLYWIFGPQKFKSYTKAIRKSNLKYFKRRPRITEQTSEPNGALLDAPNSRIAFERIAEWSFEDANSAKLLIDGAFFDALFEGIEHAQSYILLEYYILRNDALGAKFADALIRKVKQGVRVFVIYDRIGCYGLKRGYVKYLKKHGVQIYTFPTTPGIRRFKINFRNHRKLAVFDGKSAIVGGHNIGDEYLSGNERFKIWRDTSILITGASVAKIQQVFESDWYWVTEKLLDLQWEPDYSGEGNCSVLPVQTDPARELCSGTMYFLELVAMARKRLWISTPYFVPENSVLEMLQLAVTRGIDVRIIVPRKSDMLIVDYAAQSYIAEMLAAGARVYEYPKGFIHQKLLLVDDRIVSIGSSNLDSRSMELSFELNILLDSKELGETVRDLFEKDFADSNLLGEEFISTWSPWRTLTVSFSRLFAPVL